MTTSLLDQAAVTATFKSGMSAIGHRWLLTAPDGSELGRTKLRYGRGPVRPLRFLAQLTGLRSGWPVYLDVRDADGTVVARLFAKRGWKKDEHVMTVEDGNRTLLATVRRPADAGDDDDHGYRIEDANGIEVARMSCRIGQDDPLPLLDTTGTPIAQIARVPAQLVGYGSILGSVFDMPGAQANENVRELQATWHLGFTGSQVLSVQTDALPTSQPLRTLLPLIPVITGTTY